MFKLSDLQIPLSESLAEPFNGTIVSRLSLAKIFTFLRLALRVFDARKASKRGESVWSGKTEPREDLHGALWNDRFIKSPYKSTS